MGGGAHGSVDDAAVFSDVQLRTDLGVACVQGVITCFRGFANLLGTKAPKGCTVGGCG